MKNVRPLYGGLAMREPETVPSPLRVLVVDDDDEMRSLLRRSLEFDGHHVTERDRGTQVLTTACRG
jgi:CheY-like chemotaxis protein